jgi:hypothetical protein
MARGYEKLDVYRLSIDYVAWPEKISERMRSAAEDQAAYSVD